VTEIPIWPTKTEELKEALVYKYNVVVTAILFPYGSPGGNLQWRVRVENFTSAEIANEPH
jgi:hypothetical protein